MKMILRVLAGLVVIVVIFLGLKQLKKGVRELPGEATPPPQEIGETFTSTENGYSHRIPKDWESKPATPSAAAMIAPKSNGLSSKMVTTIEPYSGTLRAYVDANIQSFKKRALKGKIAYTEFTTDSKTPAYKVKLQTGARDVDLAETIYIFQGSGDKKIIVTCTAPAKFQAQLEPLFDACMKTFALSTS